MFLCYFCFVVIYKHKKKYKKSYTKVLSVIKIQENILISVYCYNKGFLFGNWCTDAHKTSQIHHKKNEKQ